MKFSWPIAVFVVGISACLINTPSARADDNPGTVVELNDFKSQAPAAWKPIKTETEMRVYQFAIAAAKGDKQPAELVIFWFNGQGGPADANVKRWKGMFRPPDGKTIDDVSKVTTMELAGGKVKATYLNVHGTYHFRFPPFAPNAREETRPDYRMLAVVFETDKGPYFIRMVGPERTVTAGKKAFDGWLKAFK